MQEVAVTPRSTRGFRDVLETGDCRSLDQALDQLSAVLDGRRLWHVNSTAAGGGVAEMLSGLLPYADGAGIDVHWLVVAGGDGFFDVTKRIHNYLHDSEGDGGALGQKERDLYDRSLEDERSALLAVIEPGDVAVLHDPQTAGLVPALKRHGVQVVWRCHVGVDAAGKLARTAWDFLRGDTDVADAVVFSRTQFVWDGLAPDRVVVMAPCIDVLSSKNHPLDAESTAAILDVSGIVPVDGARPAAAGFPTGDGSDGKVTRRARMTEDGPVPPDAGLVVQVSRWDRLKDPVGVVRSFLTYGGPADAGAHLVVAGPATDSVDDDPESTEAFAEVCSVWEQLDRRWKSQVHLACLPMDDADENSAMVNALQRRADVVVQKSIAEGFGLTVAEAMWKDRPVVASRVGGIQDQIVDGESGVLIDDPRDVDGFGHAVAELLADGDRARRVGAAAHQQICDHFLPLHHFAAEADLLERVLE